MVAARGCSWVEVEQGSPPLCSACAGSGEDMFEAIKRGMKWLASSSRVQASDMAIAIGKAAIERRDKRDMEKRDGKSKQTRA
jgi:hypothetical protein